MSDLEIVVVTKVPDPDASSGNMAMAGFDLYWTDWTADERDESHLEKVRPLQEVLTEMFGDERAALNFILNLRQPVFELGEVMILNEYGREIGGPGRKPSKWFIETEAVDTLDEAYALSQTVMRAERMKEDS